MSELNFGKKHTEESYFRGAVSKKRVTYEIPIPVQNRNQALTEIMKSLDVISSKETDEVTLKIENDKKTGTIRMITKTYTVDE